MADIQGVATNTPIPRALAILADDPNPGVDAALAIALPTMAPEVQEEVLHVLGRRGHAPTLAEIVVQFGSDPQTEPPDAEGAPVDRDHGLEGASARAEARGSGGRVRTGDAHEGREVRTADPTKMGKDATPVSESESATAAGAPATRDHEFRSLLVRHVSDLHSGLRAAVESPEPAARLAAVSLILAANDVRSAYLLSTALRTACHETQSAAANALREMTARLLAVADEVQEGPSPTPAHDSHANGRTAPAVTPARSAPAVTTARSALVDATARSALPVAPARSALADAVAHAVRGWEIHLQLPVLEAAMWLAPELEPVIVEKLNEPRSRIGHALQSTLETATDARMAGFAFRALAIPWLRAAAAKTLGRAGDAAFLRALASGSRLLANTKVSAGCHWIHDCAWARSDGQWPKGTSPAVASRLVHLFARTGVSSERKMAVLRAWVRSSEECVRQAALEVLLADRSDGSTRVLAELGIRSGGTSSDVARWEIRRRRRMRALVARGVAVSPLAGATSTESAKGDAAAGGTLEDGSAAGGPAPGKRASAEALEGFLDEFDFLPPGERRLQADLFRNVEGDLDPRVPIQLRAKLASGEPLERALGLRAAREFGLVQELAERIYPLAYDPDPFVRSIAVATLVEIPGVTVERILRQAVDDVDPRVQANAIAAADRLNVPDRVRWTESKLDSRDNRVRANAVCSLLRLDLRHAGEALLDMMSDPSPEHRMSALWVIERLRLQSAARHVVRLSREDPEERIRERAARVLATLANESGESFAGFGFAEPASAVSEFLR